MSVGYIDTGAELQGAEPPIWVTWLQPARSSRQSLHEQFPKQPSGASRSQPLLLSHRGPRTHHGAFVCGAIFEGDLGGKKRLEI